MTKKERINNPKKAKQSSTYVLLKLLRLFKLLLERERRKRPSAKLGKLGEGLDPRETQRVKLLF